MSWKNWVLNPELISIVLGLAAMVLLVCTAALNLAAFLLARRRAHK